MPPRSYQQGSAGTNSALIDAGVVVLTTLLTTVLLLGISGQIHDSTAASLIGGPPAPLLLAPQSTPILAGPRPQASRPLATPSPANSASTPLATPDDTEVQAAIDKKVGDDDSLSQLGITATVTDGTVILIGTAPSDEIKDKVEKLVRSVKGVRKIDNQIVVISQ
ncbi:MAG: BON domain-containing protein [Acidobacteriota bacterium]|nr:BON domain-containing protein [Acidobacteriota bacterium]